MNEASLLDAICRLSHEFGGDAYVRGGGGNTSCKTASTLFIKPSGTTLARMTADAFIGLSRNKIDQLYAASFPEGADARESAVAAFMAASVLPGHQGRPSVEAPLHHCFEQRFVVHTHPALVNGMTCGADGEKMCAALFPGAMWMPVIEPGYTLSVRVRDAMRRHREAYGRPPEMIFLANHGVFIAHDDPEGVRELYREVLEKIGGVVAAAGKGGEPERGGAPDAGRVARVTAAVRGAMGDAAACHAVSGRFALPTGAISPDHIVYCRTHMYEGDASGASLEGFCRRYGYWPRVVAVDDAVFGFGPTQNVADLALELAWDGAMVVRYAEAFGGITYLEERFVRFIENWEVESYRQKVAR